MTVRYFNRINEHAELKDLTVNRKLVRSVRNSRQVEEFTCKCNATSNSLAPRLRIYMSWKVLQINVPATAELLISLKTFPNLFLLRSIFR